MFVVIAGALYIYNKRDQRVIPIRGKHTKRISCGAWSSENKLALGSADKQITISNAEGDNVCDQISLKAEPADLAFNEQKTTGAEKGEGSDNTVSVNMNKKTLYLCNLQDIANPIELQFQPKYGSLGPYKWFGDGYIMIGFGSGYVNAISTHMKEIGEVGSHGRSKPS